LFVTPAEAGVQKLSWIPASAGMTINARLPVFTRNLQVPREDFQVKAGTTFADTEDDG
jgi:hypothetical protein